MSDGSVSACGSGHRALPEYSGKVLLVTEVWSLNFPEVHGQTRPTAEVARCLTATGTLRGADKEALHTRKAVTVQGESFGRVGKTRRQTGEEK